MVDDHVGSSFTQEQASSRVNRLLLQLHSVPTLAFGVLFEGAVASGGRAIHAGGLSSISSPRTATEN